MRQACAMAQASAASAAVEATERNASCQRLARTASSQRSCPCAGESSAGSASPPGPCERLLVQALDEGGEAMMSGSSRTCVAGHCLARVQLGLQRLREPPVGREHREGASRRPSSRNLPTRTSAVDEIPLHLRMI